MTRYWPTIVAVLGLLGGAGSLRAEAPALPEAEIPADATELETMVVRPMRDPLWESQERLRRMMEDAPCLGCGPAQDAARRNPYGVVGAVAGDLVASMIGGYEPPNPNLEQRIEARVVNEWRLAEYGPEMEAFR